jgi:hypothetical protein
MMEVHTASIREHWQMNQCTVYRNSLPPFDQNVV